MLDKLKSVFNGIGNIFRKVKDMFKSFGSEVYKKAKKLFNDFGTMFDELLQFFNGFLKKIFDFFKNLLKKLLDFLNSIFQKLLNFFNYLMEKLRDILRYIVIKMLGGERKEGERKLNKIIKNLIEDQLKKEKNMPYINFEYKLEYDLKDLVQDEKKYLAITTDLSLDVSYNANDSDEEVINF